MKGRRLTQRLTVVREEAPVVTLPLVQVVPCVGVVTAYPVRAILDTGAPAVLGTMKLARRLGMDLDALRATRDSPVLPDVDGLPLASYGALVHLTLGDPREGDVVALGETPVYFTEASSGAFDLRLGWAGFLDRVTFTLYGTLGLFDLERVD